MRLEIIVPDDTSADILARLTSLTKRLSAQPELVDEIDLDEDDEAIQRLFTPALLAEIDAAHADMNAGNFVTLEQSKAAHDARRAAWIAAHPQ